MADGRPATTREEAQHRFPFHVVQPVKRSIFLDERPLVATDVKRLLAI